MSYNVPTKDTQTQNVAVWPETRRSQVYDARFTESEESLDELIIDRALIEMIDALPKGLDFAKRIDDFKFNTLLKLDALKVSHSERNARLMEDLAGELSRIAITVGAVKILRLCYELQSLARCNAFDEAARLLSELNLAFFASEKHLRETFESNIG